MKIAVEPNGPPFYDIDFRGGDDWYKDSDKIARSWGVARLPLAYDLPAAEASEFHSGQEQADNHHWCVVGSKRSPRGSYQR